MTLSVALALALLGAQQEPLVLLWTGETHAMLEPCTCPFRPEGGLSRRATAISREMRSGRAILVDAGGWAAGGLYDEYTEGAEADRIRSEATARAMARMGYDAVAISDEELLDGGELISKLASNNVLPLVSANLLERGTSKTAFPPFRLIDRAGWKVGVVGLTPIEPDIPSGRFELADPLEAARKAVKLVREAGADMVVMLSPLGEEISERLAFELTDVDVVINAHRRSTTSPYFRVGQKVVLQFDFQGRSLRRAEFSREGKQLRFRTLEPIPLDPEIPDDPEIAAEVERAKKAIQALADRRKLPVELFKMALCPYAATVEKVLAEISGALGVRLELRVTQVVRFDARGKLTSLRGTSELDEAKRQAAIFTYYPQRYWAYAEWRAANPLDADWEGACRRLGISASRIKGSIASGEAETLLAKDARRAERLHISGSPVLYIGGKRYEGLHERNALLKAICGALPGGPAGTALCEGLPACFSDADCRKPGFIGECLEAGTSRAACAYWPAMRVPLTVLEDSSAVYSPSQRILESLAVFFPGLVVNRVEYRSPEGEALAALHGLDRLPAYILGKEALSERKIEGIREALTPSNPSKGRSELILLPRLAGSHQDITRPRAPGRVDLFLAPHSAAAAEVLEDVLELERRGEAGHVRLRSAVYRDRDGRLAAPGGLSELEAMLREAAVREFWPEKFLDYLRARLQRVGSSYWEDPLRAVGLDPAAVRTVAEGILARAFLEADAQELAELGAGGPVVLLVSNQELVPAYDRKEIRHAIAAARELAAREDLNTARTLQGISHPEAIKLLTRALESAPQAAQERIAEGLSALARHASQKPSP